MFWPAAATEVLNEAHAELFFWKSTEAQIEQLIAFFEQYQNDNRSIRLPDYIELAFQKLHLHLESTKLPPLRTLAYAFPASQEMKHRYRFPHPTYENKHVWQGEHICLYAVALNPIKKPEKYRVDYCFKALVQPELSIHSRQSTVNDIEHMLEHDEKATALISLWVARKFANVVLFVRMQAHLGTFTRGLWDGQRMDALSKPSTTIGSRATRL